MIQKYTPITAFTKDSKILRIYAIEKGMRISEFLREMINEYSDEHPDFRRLVESMDEMREGGYR